MKSYAFSCVFIMGAFQPSADAFAAKPFGQNTKTESITFTNSYLQNLRNDEVKVEDKHPMSSEEIPQLDSPIQATSYPAPALYEEPKQAPVLYKEPEQAPVLYREPEKPSDGTGLGTVSITNTSLTTVQTVTDSSLYFDPESKKDDSDSKEDDPESKEDDPVSEKDDAESKKDDAKQKEGDDESSEQSTDIVAETSSDSETLQALVPYNDIAPITIAGGALETCSFEHDVRRVSIHMKTEGRPLNANIELWQFENSPQKITVYLEDGAIRPFNAIVESPGSCNSVAIRNTGSEDYPLRAGIQGEFDEDYEALEIMAYEIGKRTVQGGAVYPVSLQASVRSVKIILKTDGRPMHAQVELSKGPNNAREIIELYSEDGDMRPLNVIIETPGVGNVLRILNLNGAEFPLTAFIESYFSEDAFNQEPIYDGTSTNSVSSEDSSGPMWFYDHGRESRSNNMYY